MNVDKIEISENKDKDVKLSVDCLNVFEDGAKKYGSNVKLTLTNSLSLI